MGKNGTALYEYCTVKLILQPILENAINYGVREMDDCGEIVVWGRMEAGDLILSVEDNGLGMSEEEVEFVLTDSNRIHKHGSGVGLVNVNNRIKILFGKEYGLLVESEPDEGTRVSIRIPAVPYTEENRKILEKGRIFSRDEMIAREKESYKEKKPDEGTRVSIRIPAVPYTEENRKILEKGRIFSRDEMIAREKESYKEKKDEE